MKKISTKEIALAGISAAMAVIFCVLSRLVSVATVAFMALASVSLALPLFIDSGIGCILAYLASAGLTFAFPAYPACMPYVLMFGPYPIVFYYLKKYLKKIYFCLPIKIVFAAATFTATFFAMGLKTSDFPIVDKVSTAGKFAIIYAVLIFVFVVFDFAYDGIYEALKKRLEPTWRRFR